MTSNGRTVEIKPNLQDSLSCNERTDEPEGFAQCQSRTPIAVCEPPPEVGRLEDYTCHCQSLGPRGERQTLATAWRDASVTCEC